MGCSGGSAGSRSPGTTGGAVRHHGHVMFARGRGDVGRGWWVRLNHRRGTGVTAGNGFSADAGWWAMRGEVLFCGFETLLGSGDSAGQDVIGRQALQRFSAKKCFQALPSGRAAHLEFSSPDGQGDGAPQWFGSGFYFSGSSVRIPVNLPSLNV